MIYVVHLSFFVLLLRYNNLVQQRIYFERGIFFTLNEKKVLYHVFLIHVTFFTWKKLIIDNFLLVSPNLE